MPYEGEKLRFGDLITVVAFVLIHCFNFLSLGNSAYFNFGLTIWSSSRSFNSVLLGGLIIGYVFSGRMNDSRRESIVKISILFTVLMLFSIVLNNAVPGEDFTEWAQESYLESNPAASLTTLEWFMVGGLFIGSQMFMNGIVLLLLSSVGLLIGTIVRKKKKN